jgi:hypothetical protein
VQAPQHRLAVRDVTQAEHHVLAASGFVEEAMHGEDRKGSREFRGGNKDDGHVVLLGSRIFQIDRLYQQPGAGAQEEYGGLRSKSSMLMESAQIL